ncbi:hypothetical protein [Streptomyces sp. CA-106110]
MIGLVILMFRLTFRISFAMIDMAFWACTLGKVDPRMRRFV